MAKMDLLITLSENAGLDEAAKSLKSRGLDVRKTFPRSKTIVGTGDSSLLDSFKGVDGIEDIRQEKTFRLPHMDDDTPQ